MRIIRGRSLFAQTAWTLGLGIVLLQVLSVVIIVVTVLYPLTQRSAEDLAGLILISAKTYVELPAAARPAYQESLQMDNGLVLEPARGNLTGTRAVHLYGTLLSRALSRRLAMRIPVFVRSGAARTFWVQIPMDGERIWVHFDRRRLASSLPVAIIFILTFSTLALVILTIVLVRRVLRPLAILSTAVGQSWNAPLPELPREGPQELLDLIGAFARMRTRLQAMVDHQSLLLTGISHDLRSPLARLRMAWELLPEDVPPHLREGMLQDLERTESLLAQALALGRGMMHRRAADFDLGVLLRELAEEFGRAGGICSARIPEHFPFRGDREALRRLLGNLFDNALQHGGGQVGLRLEKAAGRWLLILCDAGPGIPEAVLEQVFEPFFRFDNARGHSKGSGLGLAIARQLAEAQGMLLRLYNAPQGGLCAELSWPIRRLQ